MAGPGNGVIGTLLTNMCRTRGEVAGDLGISPAALYSWSVGRRKPRGSNLRELARAARAQAQELNELADELEGKNAQNGSSASR